MLDTAGPGASARAQLEELRLCTGQLAANLGERIAALSEAVDGLDFNVGPDQLAVTVPGFAEDGVVLLSGLLADRDRNIKIQALRLIAKLQPDARRAIPEICRTLEDSDEGVRTFAAMALGTMTNDSATVVPFLIAALGDEERDVCFHSVQALKNHGAAARDATKQLVALVTKGDLLTREAAASALEQIGPAAKEAFPKVLVKLKRALADDDNLVSKAKLRGAIASISGSAHPA